MMMRKRGRVLPIVQAGAAHLPSSYYHPHSQARQNIKITIPDDKTLNSLRFFAKCTDLQHKFHASISLCVDQFSTIGRGRKRSIT